MNGTILDLLGTLKDGIGQRRVLQYTSMSQNVRNNYHVLPLSDLTLQRLPDRLPYTKQMIMTFLYLLDQYNVGD